MKTAKPHKNINYAIVLPVFVNLLFQFLLLTVYVAKKALIKLLQVFASIFANELLRTS